VTLYHKTLHQLRFINTNKTEC